MRSQLLNACYNLKLQVRISSYSYFSESFTVLKRLIFLLFLTKITDRNPYSRNIFKLRYLDSIFTICFSISFYIMIIIITVSTHNWFFQIFLQGFWHFLSSRSSGAYIPWIFRCKDILSPIPLGHEKICFTFSRAHKNTNSSQKKLHQKSTSSQA